MTLAAAVEQLRKQTKINIVLDNLTIQQQLGIVPEQSPLTGPVDLKDVKRATSCGRSCRLTASITSPSATRSSSPPKTWR